MSHYKFASPSPVHEVVFHHANDRPPVALLSASENTTPDQILTIRRTMESKGWNCVPETVDNKEVLQVSGFGQEERLLHFMQQYRFLEGQPEFTPDPGDNAKRTAGEWIQGNGLKIAGWLNLLGDVTLLGSGLMSGRGKVITAGALYTAGAGVLARYANVKTEHHVREILEDTASFLKQQAVNMPENCGLSAILKEKKEGLIPDAERFLYRYPSEVMLGAYTLGAFTMLQSGIKQGNPWGIAYGANSLGLKAASLLIPEKHKTEEEKKAAQHHSPVGKFIDWVQEKPLRVFGFGSMVSDVFLGLSALREYKADKRQIGAILTFITSGTYVMADALFAVSNKDHANTADGKFDADEQRQIESLVAETIGRQPKALQEALINNVSGFLATHPEMQGTAMEIAKSITRQLQHMKHNPWACRTEAASPVTPIANR